MLSLRASRAFVLYVPDVSTCLTYLYALRIYVSHGPTYLRAFASYVPSFLYVSYMRSFFRCLHFFTCPHSFTYLMCFHFFYVPSFFASFTCLHFSTCHHFFTCLTCFHFLLTRLTSLHFLRTFNSLGAYILFTCFRFSYMPSYFLCAFIFLRDFNFKVPHFLRAFVFVKVLSFKA